jgi:hypothetical protein
MDLITPPTKQRKKVKNKTNKNPQVESLKRQIENKTLDILSHDPMKRKASAERIAKQILAIDQELPCSDADNS